MNHLRFARTDAGEDQIDRDRSEETGDLVPTSRLMASLLEAGKVIPRQSETLRERAFARALAAVEGNTLERK
jgi:hypothetical protein